MAEIKPMSDPLVQQALRPEQPLLGAWAKFRLFLSRSIFWSYERGSWQYDIICAAILAFIFLTPRALFRDRPTLELSDLRHRQGMIEVGRTQAGSVFLVDARLVESMEPLTSEEAVKAILQARLKHPVTLKSLEPVLDKNGVMLGYTAVVSP
ncbi:MAG TPA: hypothetical protein VL523_19260 [Terriglobia bacterium]|nr:hypothetical protein [Terriglobia bacterium]